MKIVLTGTHSTGKTTLVNTLALDKQFKGFHVSYSNTRSLKDKGLPINCKKEEDFNATQDLVLTFHMKDLMKENLLADRCLVDGLAYTQFLNARGSVSNETLELFGQMTSMLTHQYDYIFYAPIKKRAEDDGVRDLDEGFRLAVDLTIKNNLLPGVSQMTNVFELPSDKVEENVEFILKMIKETEKLKTDSDTKSKKPSK